jgi:hypothetical protein
MNKETVLNVIKRKVRQEFTSINKAAEAMGVSRNNLSLALNDKTVDIPDYLLERYGYTKVVPETYYRTIK